MKISLKSMLCNPLFDFASCASNPKNNDLPANRSKLNLSVWFCSIFVTVLALSCDPKDRLLPQAEWNPPSVVTDLRVFASSNSTVTLRWTAPGADGIYGQAAQYDLRFSISRITEDNWANGILVSTPPPKPGTFKEEILVPVEAFRELYFAVKTKNGAGQWSALSNVVSTKEPWVVMVCPDQTKDFTNIQGGADHARSGDVVELCEGYYSGSDNRDVDCSDLTVRSYSGNPQNCIVDCEGKGAAFSFSGGRGSLQGITVINGFSTTGAVECSNMTQFTLENCIFDNSFGGAVRIANSEVEIVDVTIRNSNNDRAIQLIGDCSGIIESCDFLDNRAGGLVMENVDVEISSCNFTRNAATEGAGIFVHMLYPGGDLILEVIDCAFTGNTATSNGGGIYLGSGSVSYDARFEDCSFQSNFAASEGGAIYVVGEPSISMNAMRSSFLENSAGAGGAIYGWGGVRINACEFLGNDAESQGGALYKVMNGAFVNDCSFVANKAPQGAGVFLQTTGFNANNCIFAYNIYGEAIFATNYVTASISCTDIYGNEGGDWIGGIQDLFPGGNNLNLDPLFCDAAGFSDIRLDALSPCIGGECVIMGAAPAGCE